MKKRYKIILIAAVVIVFSGCFELMSKMFFKNSYEVIKTIELGHSGSAGQKISTPVWALTFSPDGSEFASGSGGMGFSPGMINIFETGRGNCLISWTANIAASRVVQYTNDGLKIAVGGSDVETGSNEPIPVVKLFDRKSGNLEKSWILDTGMKKIAVVYALAMSPDSTKIAGAGQDKGMIKIWNVSDGSLFSTINAESWGTVYSLLFSPDGTKIISGGAGIKIWDIASGKLEASTKEYMLPVESMAFSPDKTKIVCGNMDYSIRIYDTSSLTLIKELKASGDSNHVAWSGDGSRIVAGGSTGGGWFGGEAKGTVDIWNAFTYELIDSFEGYSGVGVTSLAISPDSSKIVTGSYYGTIKIWQKK